MIMRAAIYKFNKMEGSVEDFLYLYNQTFVAVNKSFSCLLSIVASVFIHSQISVVT